MLSSDCNLSAPTLGPRISLCTSQTENCDPGLTLQWVLQTSIEPVVMQCGKSSVGQESSTHYNVSSHLVLKVSW